MFIASANKLVAASSAAMALESFEPHGDSVRERKTGLHYGKPGHLYLIYLTMDATTGLVVRHLWKNIQPEDVETEENAFITAAAAGGSMATNFDLIEFRRPSYLTIVLDADGWEFYYPDPTNVNPDPLRTHDPIVFLGSKDTLEEDPNNPGTWIPNPQMYALNYAFYDCESLHKHINGHARKAIRCINYFTSDSQGTYVGATPVRYSFNIRLRIPYSTDPSAKKVMVIIDPDGQNLGPYP